ncbi:hypothetical protein A2631_03000 [Candidatus Daviesbacteria bacterium RIFCSPHIGHO2_01_FULL_44_29]|uniref:Membrane protein 6-pyruvoyl-tetrahydropterin synthase-related domain-containing protein n=1 Tax=Candidatus Daviesbacteria bacterium RIFCSPHIGHO2_02_FULL_43_12 TaxID=1797776 RepID=A0A1F5KKD0_9BACT|nr:MAG: hypothetical protein A2631_03000 [Candidatus Daviesbacteria bacterium RIFCSPHIGHO2_01_FULL_44_29]OGE40795.1 MAG: hypothetical protein A3E86_02345 [Candidatus Daviesbacteria bacterium RIFCSPHIGHO2_12_FULL_47_45]OGE41352.1 MAG: hypothetical protein A3D25_02395 [Candidatus Daviesbacteria bacterium RIFCSPHIGHO2_02_FULL_43_12]OGE69553.1 MAG: hypothetical protein A3B55_04140 [Candidatus Daviesbacteria bacterium RIFCSPLOWO2_01_FULL_43_15]
MRFPNLKKSTLFVLGLIITCALLWPLLAAPYFTHHDDVQVIRLFEMNKCIQDSQIPCRWVPDLGGLYGYPMFNYYAPLPYYFGLLVYWITQTLTISAKVMFGVAFVMSYVFMYLAGRKLWGNAGGFVSGVFYSLAPYHSVLLFVRGAMGELWGVMCFPAILWALLRLKEKQSLGNLLTSAFFIGLLLVSHNISVLMFLPSLLILVGLFKEKLRFLKYFVLACVLGLGLSAFYLLPMVVEKNLVHVDTTTMGYFSYTEHFKGLRKLFLDHSWGWGASVREVPGGEKDGLSFQIGYIHLLGWALSLYTAFVLRRKNRFLSTFIFTCTFLILGAVFMVNPQSVWVWKLFDPVLKYLQFPWRFLSLIIFFISLVSGSISVVLKGKFQKFVIAGLVLICLIINFSYFRPQKLLFVSDQVLLSEPNWTNLINRSIFDYLPIYAVAPPAKLAATRFEVITGDTKIEDFKEGSNWISFKTQTLTHSILRISQYYFPNWRIFIDGKETKIDYTNPLGLMTIIVGVGNHKVDARLYDTPIRTIGNLVTLVSFGIFCLLFLFQLKVVRVRLIYYLKGLYR